MEDLAQNEQGGISCKNMPRIVLVPDFMDTLQLEETSEGRKSRRLLWLGVIFDVLVSVEWSGNIWCSAALPRMGKSLELINF